MRFSSRVRLNVAGAAAALALALVPASAQAQSLAIQSFTGGIVSSGNFFLGYRFTANADISVTSLGVLATITQSHTAGLYDIGGNQLALVTVQPTDTIDGQWRFAPITPVPLTSGQDYVIASDSNSDLPFVFNPTSSALDPAITWVEDRFKSGAAAGFPAAVDGGATPGFFQVNFRFNGAQQAAAPEPGVLALLGVGLGVAGLARRRRVR